MRTSPALVAVGNSHESAPSPVDEGIRSLVRIVTRVKIDKDIGPFVPGCASEEVLVDAEADRCPLALTWCNPLNHSEVFITTA